MWIPESWRLPLPSSVAELSSLIIVEATAYPVRVRPVFALLVWESYVFSATRNEGL